MLSDVLSYIPFVVGDELLDRAVLSVKSLWPTLVILDQSEAGNVWRRDWSPDPEQPRPSVRAVYRLPYRSKTFSEMMNWMQTVAKRRAGTKYLVFMHADAEVTAGAELEVIERARSDPKAGVVFSNYDAFACFQMDAVGRVGAWDEKFPWYYADVDYYRRMSLAGYELPRVAEGKVIHHASQTIALDPAMKRQNDVDVVRAEQRYLAKWGGPPGAEAFATPYDRGEPG